MTNKSCCYKNISTISSMVICGWGWKDTKHTAQLLALRYSDVLFSLRSVSVALYARKNRQWVGHGNFFVLRIKSLIVDLWFLILTLTSNVSPLHPATKETESRNPIYISKLKFWVFFLQDCYGKCSLPVRLLTPSSSDNNWITAFPTQNGKCEYPRSRFALGLQNQLPTMISVMPQAHLLKKKRKFITE